VLELQLKLIIVRGILTAIKLLSLGTAIGRVFGIADMRHFLLLFLNVIFVFLNPTFVDGYNFLLLITFFTSVVFHDSPDDVLTTNCLEGLVKVERTPIDSRSVVDPANIEWAGHVFEVLPRFSDHHAGAKTADQNGLVVVLDEVLEVLNGSIFFLLHVLFLLLQLRKVLLEILLSRLVAFQIVHTSLFNILLQVFDLLVGIF
jgi:hypothetical protein